MFEDSEHSGYRHDREGNLPDRQRPDTASTLVWTAGTVPNPLVSSLPCEKERNRLMVREYCKRLSSQVSGLWAIVRSCPTSDR